VTWHHAVAAQQLLFRQGLRDETIGLSPADAGGLMTKVKRVLIVGAGMAGASLAIALRQRGLNPDIVERDPTWPKHGAGIYLLGNATRALRSLGVENEVVSAGAPIRTQHMLTYTGRSLATIRTESVWGSCGPCVGLSRARLLQTLVDALGDATVMFGTTVLGLEEHESETIVTLSDGSVRAYDLVVGADGVRSSIRRLMFPDTHPRFCGQIGWRFVVRCPPAISGWTLFTGRRGVFLLLPIGGGLAYCYADAAVAQPFVDPPEGRIERLRMRFANYASPVPDALAELRSADQIHVGVVEEIVQEPWSRGRLLLIGDAAHATSPNMASGAGMAFEDAIVLSRLLGSDMAASELAIEFTRRREARIGWIRDQTRQRDRIRNLPLLIRDLLIQSIGVHTYKANYRPLLTEV
jgi:2-polyprenyl-6-methoxyphenol hydroxylase-like FAD-dependent oxidoreductase